MIFSLLLAVAGVGILAALLFNAAVYALPVVVGIWTLQQAIAHGSGAVSAIMLAIVAGALAYAAGHIVFETRQSKAIRLGAAVLFVLPAIAVGYTVAPALLSIGSIASVVQQCLAGIGGVIVGGTTFARLTANRDRSFDVR